MKLLRLYLTICALLIAAWVCFAHAQSPMSMTGMGLMGPQASGGGGCSQATALLARMDGSENTSAVTTAVCGMVTDGTYSLLDELQVWAINSQTNALLNWAQNAYNGTTHGTVSFTANKGYTGDAASFYISTGFTPSTAGGHMTTDNGSLGFCSLTASLTYGWAQIGAENSGGNGYSYVGDGSTNYYYDINDENFPSYTGTNGQGDFVISRTSSALIDAYSAGSTTPVASSTTASGGRTMNEPMVMFALGGASVSDFTGVQMAWGFWGAALTAAQYASIYSRLHVLLQADGETTAC